MLGGKSKQVVSSRARSGFRNFIFWPYQALPGLTGLDREVRGLRVEESTTSDFPDLCSNRLRASQ